MFMKKRSFIFRSILSWMFVAMAIGCATSDNSLQLESVMDSKTKNQSLNQQPAEVTNEDSMTEKELGNLSVLKEDEQQLLEGSKLDPSELIWLSVPPDYAFLDSTNSDFAKLTTGLSEKFPGASALWRSEKSDVLIIAGKILLKAEVMEGLSQEALLKEVEKLGAQYESFYKMAYKGITFYRISSEGPLTSLSMDSRYSMHGFPQRDIRYIFISHFVKRF